MSQQEEEQQNYTFEQFENQRNEILNETKKVPILSKNKFNFNELNLNDENFLKQVKFLEKNYKYWRQIRGDGNCFFRGFIFGLLEYSLQNFLQKDNDIFINKIITILNENYNYLINELKYPEYCLEDFYFTTKTVFEEILQKKIVNLDQLIDNYFNDENIEKQMLSEALICFFRFLLSSFIQKNSQDYFPFLFDTNYKTIKDFCNSEIEVMNQESDNLHISALVNCFSSIVGVRIEMLDARERENVVGYNFPDDEGLLKERECILYFLFRPGHYDLIYKD
ncbi:hypothetical protein ABK040_013959 [Willaertia magna]